MKSKFNEFYPATKKELEEIWNTGIISLDANILLNLYRYSDSTRKDFLDAIESVADRVWITFQAGSEFHNNRITVISDINYSYKKTETELQKIISEAEKKIKTNIHKYQYKEIEPLIKKLNDCILDIKKDISKREEKTPNLLNDDTVLEKLSNILDGKIGDCFTSEEYEKNFTEGEKRYKEKTPPGYMDEGKDTQDKKVIYGDFLLWEELIKKSKNENKPMVFITDDSKEDWWMIKHSETIMPRDELLREFKMKTKNHIVISKSHTFLAKINPSNEGSVKEINSIQNQLKYYQIKDLNLKTNQRVLLTNYLSISPRLKGLDHMPIESQEAAYQLYKGDVLILSPEPENIYDQNAIKVFTKENVHIGYIPKEHCKWILSLMNKNKELQAKIKDIDKTSTIPLINIVLKSASKFI